MEDLLRTYKLITIDIDGTLLTPTGEITPRTRSAIQAAQQRGIIVTLATARRYLGTQGLANELGIELPLIIYDGALIIHHPSQTILFSQRLSGHVAQQVVDVFQRYHVQPVVQPYDWQREEVWTGPTEYDNPELALYLSFLKGRIRRLPYSLLCQDQPDPLRVLAFASEEVLQAIVPGIAHLDCSWHTFKLGNYGSAELSIMALGCSKGHAVATLAAFYHIPLEQVMAIGDNANDLEMLQSVGWGVAMGQAPQVVKDAAKAVTATNLEEGVALAIEQYALLGAGSPGDQSTPSMPHLLLPPSV